MTFNRFCLNRFDLLLVNSGIFNTHCMTWDSMQLLFKYSLLKVPLILFNLKYIA